jgi:hypothetical protein
MRACILVQNCLEIMTFGNLFVLQVDLGFENFYVVSARSFMVGGQEM